MTGEIKIIFDTDKQQMMVSAMMETQEQKNFTIGELLKAIKIVIDYKPNPIIRAASLPGGNGTPPIPIRTH